MRKGGDTALAVAAELRGQGLDAELTLLGGAPHRCLPDDVRALGIVDRFRPEGRALVEGLLAGSHFLLLPSRADAFPAVVREASAFGLPCLAAAVGGVPELVRHGINGRTFAPSAGPDVYAAAVLELMARPDRYRELALSSRLDFEARLEWGVAGKAFLSLLAGLPS